MKTQQSENRIEWLSEQIEINPFDFDSIQQRSLIFSSEGMLNQAISDCTKLIHFDISREHYVQRSKLYHSKRKYLDAFKDLQIAKNIKKKSQEQTAADIFLQHSICMKSVVEVEQLATILQKQQNNKIVQPYQQTMQQLLRVKQLKILQLQNERKKQIEQLKKYYEKQNLQLKQLLQIQLAEIKLKLNNNYVNYQRKFKQELKKSALSQSDVNKLNLYFQYFASEMEKYYIAAKHLHKLEDKNIKFEDFQHMITNKLNNKYLTKLYKFLDKNNSEIQKIEQVLQHIPYIGSTFKIIKSTMKIFGWVEAINIQQQCENIELLAVNITSFNEFSTNIAYYLTIFFQKHILSQKVPLKSKWQILSKKIKQLKSQYLGRVQYQHILSSEEEIVKNYAIIHASILMIAFACRQVMFDRQALQEINVRYQANQKDVQELMKPIIKIINQIQRQLKCQIKQQLTDNNQKMTRSSQYCRIY